MFDAFARLISFFYDVWPSFAFAICGLTVAVRLVLFPLTAKQARSMQAMQRVQPELKRLQQKYKNDRQKLNEEMMKFYREHKINPLASCLPLLLQLPLFLVLYRVINGLTHTIIVGAVVVGGAGASGRIADDEGFRYRNVDFSGGEVVNGRLTDGRMSADVVVDNEVVGRISNVSIVNGRIESATVKQGETVMGTIAGIRIEGEEEGDPRRVGDPSYLPKNSALYKALQEAGGRMESLGMDLARSAASASGDGADVIPYVLLVALTVATGYYQQRQMTKRTPAASQNPQMQMMGRIFPVMFGVISWSIAAGVVLYFVVSNIWQIGQQAMIFRHVTGPTAGDKAGPDGGTSGKGKAAPLDKGPKPDGAKPAKSKPGAGKPAPGKPAPGKPRGGKPGTGRAGGDGRTSGRVTPPGQKGNKRARRKGS